MKEPIKIDRTAITKKDATRFWRRVKQDGDCWVWTAAKTDWGYGIFYFNRTYVRTHRFAWTLIHGAIPAGLCVLHACDNPPCVRHLFLGTIKDNAIDMVKKGRGNWITKPETVLRGERNGMSKLTQTDVDTIRELYRHGRKQTEIARMYNVTQAAISLVIRRRNWSGT